MSKYRHIKLISHYISTTFVNFYVFLLISFENIWNVFGIPLYLQKKYFQTLFYIYITINKPKKT